MPVPIIDIFAGPGGLGEGFSQLGWKEDDPYFKIGLSVEKEVSAHRTLRLRSFLRQFSYTEIPDEYYQYLREGRQPENLFELPQFEKQARAAAEEAWHAELRNDDSFNAELDTKIEGALQGEKNWVLIGGPPCQAYSLAGRSRNKGIEDYCPEKDERHFLYQEYLRIIGVHSPAVFVMENVKGIISSKVNGAPIFRQIIEDLRAPNNGAGARYRIFSLVSEPSSYNQAGDPVYKDSDFIIKSERFGIPQARHRVILLGIRDDIIQKGIKPVTLKSGPPANVKDVLTLPKLRSGISRGRHTDQDWLNAVVNFPLEDVAAEILQLGGDEVYEEIATAIGDVEIPDEDTGGDFVASSGEEIKGISLKRWFEDPRVAGTLNHQTKTHMVPDLHRYFYAACFAKALGRSPKIFELPESLKPAHKNRDSGHFNDRFRVQTFGRPSTTVTCHIAKDGHYYIHPDPTQCRSLTVREAARLQTFPDNYFFCGNRTSQFVQVGNAVPPLLANLIAKIVKQILVEAFGDGC